MIAIKKCPHCQEWKKVTKFGLDKNSVDGRYTYCLECDRAKQREGYAKKK